MEHQAPNPMIFQDANGLPVKFFIQKDLPQDIQTELCESISQLGGRVESKVPRSGFILIQPNTEEADRLRGCWFDPAQRPERFFVPYSYVEACKVAGTLLRQIFLENGHPIPMHIHPSIANPNARNALSLRIWHSGGNPNANAQDARVILADAATDVFTTLVKTHQADPNKYIESFAWVKKCVDKGELMFTPVVYKNPGGRRAGEERTQFTTDDEERLCQWIADKIPYKSTGGRTGNRLYQQLCDQAGDPDYLWVTRHTWQSWRERYKKNAQRLDTRITAIVEEKRPAQGEKGQYGYVRQPEEKPKRTRKKRKIDEVDNDNSYIQTVEGIVGMPGLPALAPNGQMLPHMNMHAVAAFQAMDGTRIPGSSTPSLQQANAPYPPMMSIASTSQLPPTATQASNQEAPSPSVPGALRKSPTREEDEEPEWAVRVGNAPPPAWAQPAPTPANPNGQRNANQGQGVNTGSEIEEAGPSEPVLNENQAQLALAALASINDLHILDTNLAEIARESRFTVEEVKEYYDKCGEMQRTRARFQEMRRFLQEKFGNE